MFNGSELLRDALVLRRESRDRLGHLLECRGLSEGV
jgi:hypothetical protein